MPNSIKRVNFILTEQSSVAVVNIEALNRISIHSNNLDQPSHASMLIQKAKAQAIERKMNEAVEAAKLLEQKIQKAEDKAELAKYQQWLYGFLDWGETHPIEDYRLFLRLLPTLQYLDAIEPVIDAVWAVSEEARKIVSFMKSGRLLSMGPSRKNVLSGLTFGRGTMCCPLNKWGYPEYAWDYITSQGVKPSAEFIFDAINFDEKTRKTPRFS